MILFTLYYTYTEGLFRLKSPKDTMAENDVDGVLTPVKKRRRQPAPLPSNPSLPSNLWDPTVFTPSPKTRAGILQFDMTTPPPKSPKTKRFQQAMNDMNVCPSPSPSTATTLVLSPTVQISRLDRAREQARRNSRAVAAMAKPKPKPSPKPKQHPYPLVKAKPMPRPMPMRNFRVRFRPRKVQHVPGLSSSSNAHGIGEG